MDQKIKEHLLRRNKPATLAESASKAITKNNITTDLSRELAAVNIINASNEPNIIFLGQNRPVNQFQRFQPSTQINRYFLRNSYNRFNVQPFNRFNNRPTRFNNSNTDFNYNRNRCSNFRSNPNFVNPD